MPANTSLSVVDLDFTGIKNSLINSLRSQQKFKDFDFEGSNIGVLIDLMARNSSQGGFLTNMLFAEAFLDSAQLTTSVFSRAKELNYTPRSARSASARVRVDFTASGENQPYVIQKGSSFSTLIKNTSYVFSMPETIIVSSPNTSFSFTSDIYEGVYIQDTYIYQTTEDDPYPRFKITNRSIDTTSLVVAVYEDGAQVATGYTHATSLLGINDKSQIYFIQAGDDAFFEVQFGDGVLGRKPKENSVIVLDYRVTNSDRPNGATSFSINFDPTGALSELVSDVSNNPDVVTITNSVGGAAPEDVESVRYYAPRWYQTQERAVTAQDYEILLKTAFPEINAVSVYGGEEESPPEFGKVIVCVDVADVDGVPPAKQEQYYRYLKQRCPLSIEPIFKDPLFTYIHIDTLVRYNVNITASSIDRIKTLVLNAIDAYNEQNLDDFNVTFRYSPFVRVIDVADSSIISNLTTLRLYKKTVPELQQQQNIVLKFGVALEREPTNSALDDDHRTVTSSVFTYKGERVSLRDDGEGNLFIIKPTGTTYNRVQNIGTVNYTTGEIVITGFNIDGFDGDHLKVYVVPFDRDVQSLQRNVLTIEPDEVNITVEAVRI